MTSAHTLLLRAPLPAVSQIILPKVSTRSLTFGVAAKGHAPNGAELDRIVGTNHASNTCRSKPVSSDFILSGPVQLRILQYRHGWKFLSRPGLL